MLTVKSIVKTETERLNRLGDYHISRTLPEAAFDDIVGLVADIFDVPIAFLSTIEADCHWFKSQIGIDLTEVPRSVSFCDHIPLDEGMMIIPDARKDQRFAANPMVTGRYKVRFYAGVTIKDPDGFALATLAIADTSPRKFSEKQKRSFGKFAEIIFSRMEHRKLHSQVEGALAVAEKTQRETAADRDELREVLECMPNAISYMTADNNMILWNKNYETMYPRLSNSLAPGVNHQKISAATLLNNYGEHNTEKTLEQIEEDDLKFHNETGPATLKLTDGRWIHYDRHQTTDGKKVCVRTDVTEQRIADESFRMLFANNPVPLMVYNIASLSYLDVNDAALAHYGYSRKKFLSMTHMDIRPQRERQRLVDHLGSWSGASFGEEDWTHLKADGSEILVTVYARPITYKGVAAAIVAVVDVTERRKHEESARHQAQHDALTGLPNRRSFLDSLEKALATTTGPYHTAIILVDVDHFKNVNDTMGHRAGDELISAIGKRLEEFIGEHGTVARMGGDEFTILLPKLMDASDAPQVANNLIELFSKPIQLGTQTILIGISAGLTDNQNKATDAAKLLMEADLALYKAKAGGRGTYRQYEPHMSLQMIQNRMIEQELRQAVPLNQFEVFYQPLVHLMDCSDAGFEALLRWRHPAKGMIPPATFIPIAESSGQIVSIGAWVLQQACVFAAVLKDNLQVAVNVSPAQLKMPNFVKIVSETLTQSGLAANRLELEITEAILLETSADILSVLNDLKALGVSIALDDFGTGYSGLGYLQNLPIDKIKIDRSFICNLGTDKKSEEIVRASLSIGENLGLTTLAEGIETQEQFERLKALGCRQGQGYLFSPPVPASKLSPLAFRSQEPKLANLKTRRFHK